MIKKMALSVALAAVFSFSQEEAERDSLEVSSCFLMQVGESCPNESYVNSDEDTLCCIQESDSSKSNLKLSSNRSTQIEKKKSTNNNSYNNCPNGSYKNSKGNIVCRPSSSNAGGATAVCRDGLYSDSQNRQGTCSGHGGVARWL
jgi:hypothetical protein